MRSIVVALALVIAGVPTMIPPPPVADDDLFKQMNIGFVSIGGRVTYYDPKDRPSRWFGGGQVRLYPLKYLAFEGSADHRRQDTAGSRIHTYPVQVSALIYPLDQTRLALAASAVGWNGSVIDYLYSGGGNAFRLLLKTHRPKDERKRRQLTFVCKKLG